MCIHQCQMLSFWVEQAFVVNCGVRIRIALSHSQHHGAVHYCRSIVLLARSATLSTRVGGRPPPCNAFYWLGARLRVTPLSRGQQTEQVIRDIYGSEPNPRSQLRNVARPRLICTWHLPLVDRPTLKTARKVKRASRRAFAVPMCIVARAQRFLEVIFALAGPRKRVGSISGPDVPYHTM